ncbi:hypothetical protein TNCT_560481 [Trichonephila clavata]|uniref:Reverse transcriptase domain-containing protein n=1 Tax=Trichonephila clavata TaxID=2740835 RepID=A0A8X6ITR2_TRICU|nr:hypothetical protein TNCT_560481 [Trichonephila clavata]
MKTYEPTKCLVKRHSGMYEFDDIWHVPMGKKGKPVNCEVFKNIFPMNNSDITMDEIVYAFQIPPFPNESTAEFSKWVPSVEGFLLLDIVLKENGSEELYPQLTFEAKIGYRDKREGDANWTLIFETTDSRNLQCYANENGGVQKYQYGCNFVPFFNLDNVYRDFYLINVRFPTDFIGKTSFNYDINHILDLKMLFIHEGIEFIKVMTVFKILCYPFSVALLLWFARHLYYKPLLLMEQIMLCLGTGLVLMNRVNLNPNILYLLISFRSNKIAILADVEKAFLQISMAPKDKDIVRFLIDNGENGVNVYRFNRVLFGVNASPFLLAATIKTHIEKYVEKYPDTVRILDHCFYVDDLVTGEDDVESAFDLSSTVAKIMSDAGMNLRKWISND